MGSLCYPKKLCPKDNWEKECGGHGNCNYTIGECVCDGGYWGEACDKLNCHRFDKVCSKTKYLKEKLLFEKKRKEPSRQILTR